MRVIRITAILLLLTGIMVSPGCEMERGALEERDYPILLTELKEQGPDGVLLGGEFLTLEESEVEEFGFVMGERKDALEYELPLETSSGNFEFFLNTDIPEGKTFYVRAFAAGQGYLAYGNIVHFISQGFVPSPPIVDTYTPDKATDGVEITLSGKHFSFHKENISIRCGTHQCNIISSNPRTIQFKVPKLSKGEHMFDLKVYEKQVEFGPVHILDPEISDFYPKEGFDGSEVQISGSWFGENSKVFFGEDQAEIISQSDTSLLVVSPETTIFGDVPLSIEISGKITTAMETFNILHHTVTGLSIPEGKTGDQLVIYGEGFLLGGKQPLVFIGGQAAEIISVNDDYVEVYIPQLEAEQNTVEVRKGLKHAYYEDGFQWNKSWSRLPGFPGTAISGMVSVGLGSQAYVGLGDNSGEYIISQSKEWWSYNSESGIWTQKSDFPGTERMMSKSFVAGGKIYLVYGHKYTGSTTFFNELWEYDPVADRWSEKTPPPENESMHMYRCAVGSYMGKGYVQYGNLMFVYDPQTDQWEARSTPLLLKDRRYDYQHFSLTISGRMFWFFGSRSYYGSDNEHEVYEYLPETDQWIFLRKYSDEEMKVRDYLNTFVLNGKGYLGGGGAWNQTYARHLQFYEFDPISLDLKEKEHLPELRTSPAAFAVGGSGFFGLGEDQQGNRRSELWIFNP